MPCFGRAFHFPCVYLIAPYLYTFVNDIALRDPQYYMGFGTAVSSLFLKMWRVLVVWRAGLKRIRIKNVVLFR